MSMRDEVGLAGRTDSSLGGKSADQIEREVEDTRFRVRETLDELRDRMSPGQIVDQLVDYAKTSGGGDFTRNLGRSVRDNPVPVALIGAGIAWLMMADRADARPRRRRRSAVGATDFDGDWTADDEDEGSSLGNGIGAAMSSARSGVETVSDAVSSAVSGVASAASAAYDGVAGAAASVRDTVSGAAETVGSGASRVADMAHRSADRAGDYAGRARHAAGSAAHRAGDWMDTGRRRMHDLSDGTSNLTGRMARVAEDQPLILGAVGLAIGAALGAAFPSTRTENRLFGETADALKSQAKDIAAEQMERAKAVAGEAASTMGETMSHVASTVGEKVSEAADQAKHAMKTDASPPSGENRA